MTSYAREDVAQGEHTFIAGWRANSLFIWIRTWQILGQRSGDLLLCSFGNLHFPPGDSLCCIPTMTFPGSGPSLLCYGIAILKCPHLNPCSWNGLDAEWPCNIIWLVVSSTLALQDGPRVSYGVRRWISATHLASQRLGVKDVRSPENGLRGGWRCLVWALGTKNSALSCQTSL